jgi:PleD family two-component response regulator
MNVNPQPSTLNSERTMDSASSRAVLLVGDDGRMRSLLDRRFSENPVTLAENVLQGILEASRKSYTTILINAELLGDRAAQAIGAVRRVSGSSRIVLYGEPFSETVARSAVRAGADDYLIWPVPAEELRQQLQNHNPAKDAAKNDIQPQVGMATAVQTEAALKAYHELAGLVPQGMEAITRRAEALLPEMLGVSWIKIDLPTDFNEPSRAGAETPGIKPEAFGSDAGEAAGRAVPLAGIFGDKARMILGPATQRGLADDSSRVREAAGFLGILLELAQRDQCLKRLAIIDELTGAYNRRYLENFLRQVIEQSRRERTEVTLLLFDIDDFKHYNDAYGHAAGDVILREATRLTKLCCRGHDVVARMGGDEFAVLYWDTGQPRQIYIDSADHDNGEPAHIPRDAENLPEGAPRRSHQEISLFLSNRFRRIMRTTPFPSLGPEARGVLTISGGLARFPWDGDTIEELMAKADDALLTAKRSGKNRIYLVGRPQATQGGANNPSGSR